MPGALAVSSSFKCVVGLLLLVTFSSLAGCSDGYNICSAAITENCRTFRSEAHYQRWVQGETRRQLVTAQGFPDDYREVVAVTLKEYLQNNASEFPNHRIQYFVSVFGRDADADTLAKLQQLGIEALPGSSYITDATSRPRDSNGVYLENYQVYVSNIRHLASGIYRVEFGYFCGQLCAGHMAFRLRKQDGKWVFDSKKALWYS